MFKNTRYLKLLLTFGWLDTRGALQSDMHHDFTLYPVPTVSEAGPAGNCLTALTLAADGSAAGLLGHRLLAPSKSTRSGCPKYC